MSEQSKYYKEQTTSFSRPTVPLANLIEDPRKLSTVNNIHARDFALFDPHLDTLSVTPYVIQHPDKLTEYLVYMNYPDKRPFSGLDVNKVLYVVATGRLESYGLDTEDLVSDWGRLLDPKSFDDEERLKRHQKAFGTSWVLFMEWCSYLRDSIQYDDQDPTSPKNYIIPVVGWFEREGIRTWDKRSPDESPHEHIDTQFAAGLNIPPLSDCLAIPIVGEWIVAATSKEYFDYTKMNLGYHKNSKNTRAIAVSQAGIYALLKDGLYQDSRVLKALERYARTGETKLTQPAMYSDTNLWRLP